MVEETMTAPVAGEDVFETSSLPNPPAIPDAHRATIESVTVKRFENEKGTVSIEIGLKSLDVPALETSVSIFLPKGFVEDIYVDASQLPEVEGNKQQSSFRIGVANSDNTATLQTLRKLAYEQGRTPAALGLTKPSDLDGFVSNHSALLVGLEVIMKRRADTGDDVDPRFKNKLKVRDIVSINEQNNPKAFKKYVRAWDEQ